MLTAHCLPPTARWINGYGLYQQLVCDSSPDDGGRGAGGAGAEENDSARPWRQLEGEILVALARARADPQPTALRIKKRLKQYQGKHYQATGRGATLVTKEGTAAVHDALAFLARQPPLLGFGQTQVEGLQLAGEDHVADVGVVGTASHEGSDGSHVSERQKRYGAWSGLCGECLWYGQVGSWVSGESLIDDLIVDDGVPSRGHRRCVLPLALAPATTTSAVSLSLLYGAPLVSVQMHDHFTSRLHYRVQHTHTHTHTHTHIWYCDVMIAYGRQPLGWPACVCTYSYLGLCRRCIYEPRYALAGVAVGEHAVFGKMAAIEFAAAYTDDDDAVRARLLEGPHEVVASAATARPVGPGHVCVCVCVCVCV
jgi:hypothetical protein